MRIELLGTGCPALPGVHVGVQRGSEVVDEHPAAGQDLRWLVEAQLVEAQLVEAQLVEAQLAHGPDLRGPYVHGRPGDRFLYLSWRREDEGMFRRAKLMLAAVPPELLAEPGPLAGLSARFPLAMPDGSPLCAAVRPPVVTWSRPAG